MIQKWLWKLLNVYQTLVHYDPQKCQISEYFSLQGVLWLLEHFVCFVYFHFMTRLQITWLTFFWHTDVFYCLVCFIFAQNNLYVYFVHSWNIFHSINRLMVLFIFSFDIFLLKFLSFLLLAHLCVVFYLLSYILIRLLQNILFITVICIHHLDVQTDQVNDPDVFWKIYK